MEDTNFLQKHINKYQIIVDKYSTLPDQQHSAVTSETKLHFPCQQEYPIPKGISVLKWEWFKEDDVKKFLELTDPCLIRNFLNKKLGDEKPKGAARIILIEMFYSVRKFIDKMSFNDEQVSSLLAMCLATHQFFMSSIYMSAETVFEHFKDFLISHSLTYFPNYNEVYSVEQSTKILTFFSKLYLRHLPLTRMLSLPQFCYNVFYEEPANQKWKRERRRNQTKSGRKKKAKKSK